MKKESYIKCAIYGIVKFNSIYTIYKCLKYVEKYFEITACIMIN